MAGTPWPTVLGAVEWGLPGGWREPGESVVECVLREVREETGLELAEALAVGVG